MFSRATPVFLAIVLFSLCNVCCGDEEFGHPKYMSLLSQQIDEQLNSFAALQFRPLGNTPIEVGIKVILNALDVFATASGHRILVPNTGEGEGSQIIAIASTNLCTNLSTMSEMYEAISNATVLTGADMLLDPTIEGKVPEFFLRTLEKFISIHPMLRDAYLRENSKVLGKPIPPLTEGEIDFKHIVLLQTLPKILQIYHDCPRFRYFLVNSLFACWSNEVLAKVMRERYILASSVLMLSTKTKNSDKVQTLFTEAIAQTAAKLNPETVAFSTFLQIGEILSSTILKVFAEDPELDRELQNIMSAQVQAKKAD